MKREKVNLENLKEELHVLDQNQENKIKGGDIASVKLFILLTDGSPNVSCSASDILVTIREASYP